MKVYFPQFSVTNMLWFVLYTTAFHINVKIVFTCHMIWRRWKLIICDPHCDYCRICIGDRTPPYERRRNKSGDLNRWVFGKKWSWIHIRHVNYRGPLCFLWLVEKRKRKKEAHLNWYLIHPSISCQYRRFSVFLLLSLIVQLTA